MEVSHLELPIKSSKLMHSPNVGSDGIALQSVSWLGDRRKSPCY
jgi:hypothetical protein